MEMEIHNGCSTKKLGLQETKQIHHVMYVLIKNGELLNNTPKLSKKHVDS